MAREQRSFSRNRKLVRDAKQHYGFTCQVCNFNFQEAYGELGEGYIECHHLNPLAEREGSQETTLEEVAVVCANCHRMLHRRRPALTLEQLRESLR